MDAFSFGIMPDDGKPLELIDRADWEKEIEAAKADEMKLDGERVPISLMVELPFWLMIPDCEITVSHEKTLILAGIKGNYAEVSAGNTFYDSHVSVWYIGPADELKSGNIPPCVTEIKYPIYRHMKTVILFKPEALKEAIDIYLDREEDKSLNRNRKIRRINRSHQYFCSLSFAYIPFLNNLITSYRSTSYDPFAFEVSEWDVPIWFAEYKGELIRIGLMPYWDKDDYPDIGKIGKSERSKFYATSQEDVQVEANEDITPGKLELLDALSLYHRGRFGDAVRSAVTAIEVALESQLIKLLKEKGYSDEEADRRLFETRNSFHDRIEDYEKVSQKRLPSPIISMIPYINGVRLKSELGWVRKLRHKVVHEGIRVDIFSQGLMQRAIETMTWLYRWLSSEDYDKEDNRNFTFFNGLHGRIILPFDYTETGVFIKKHEYKDAEIKTSDQLIFNQYIATISKYPRDVELFTKMSLNHLCIDCTDAPPDLADDPILRETFHIHRNRWKSLVFCLDFDKLLDTSTISQVALRSLAHMQSAGADWGSLCIINHQRQCPIELREVEESIPDDVDKIARECGITLITAPDLSLLILGSAFYKWDIDAIKDLLFLPGRQGLIPPAYHKIGIFLRFYPQHSVMSVELTNGEIIKVGDTLGIRLATRYYEELIESLEIDRISVKVATGPCKVGIKTKLGKNKIDVGQVVFIRTS